MWGAFPDDKIRTPDAETLQRITKTLPEGWKAAWSEEEDKFYFCHSESGTVQWEEPRTEGDRGKSTS